MSLPPYFRLLLPALILPLGAQSDFPQIVSGDIPANRDVFSEGFQFSPDGSNIIYLSNADQSNQLELFSVPTEEGPIQKLNDELVFNGNVTAEGLQFSPDSSRVLYLADQRIDGVAELFSVPATGGEVTKLNPDPVSEGDVSPDGVTFSPDSDLVLYRSDHLQDGAFGLFLVPADGGASTQVNRDLPPGRDVSESGFQFSPDSSLVLYHSDERLNDVFEIFAAPVGGDPVRLNDDLTAGGDVQIEDLQFTPDGSRVIYVADQRVNNVFELFSVPSTGGTPIRLSGDLVVGGDVIPESIQVSPDGQTVLYRADQEVNDRIQLYAASTTETATSRRLNSADSDVLTEGVRWTPNSQSVLFFTPPPSPALSPQLFISSKFGNDATLLLEEDAITASLIQPETLQTTSDGGLVVYLGNSFQTSQRELFSAPISTQGMSPINILNSELPAGGNVIALAIQPSPLGDRILYHADGFDNEIFEIFSVHPEGGLVDALNLEPVTGGDVADFAISPEGRRVLYLADNRTNDQQELFLTRVEARWEGPIGSWADDSQWQDEFQPRDGITAAIHEVPGDLIVDSAVVAGELELGTGTASGDPSRLIFASGGTLTLAGDFSVEQNAQLSGDGGLHLEDDLLFLPPQLETEVKPGDTLLLSSLATFHAGNTLITNSSEASGRLAVLGPLTLMQTSEITVVVAGSFSTSAIQGTGNITLGGSLRLFFSDSFAPQAGDTFQILEAQTFTGQFASLTLPTLADGLFWNSSALSSTGELAVTSRPPSYDEFFTFYGLGDAAESFENDDDGDGLVNGLEFLLGLNPTVADFDGSALSIANPTAESDLRLNALLNVSNDSTVIAVIESTTTLSDSESWSPIATRTDGNWSGDATVNVGPSSDGLAKVTLTGLPQDSDKRFYRLRALLEN
jgi:Tol biopolymer transport system component